MGILGGHYSHYSHYSHSSQNSHFHDGGGTVVITRRGKPLAKLAATAIHHGLTLVTADERLLAYSHAMVLDARHCPPVSLGGFRPPCPAGLAFA